MVFISLHLGKLFSPFLADTTYYKHVVEYILVGIISGYTFNVILYGFKYGVKEISNKIIRPALHVIIPLFGVSIFTAIDYFESIRNENYSLILLSTSFLVLSVIVSTVLRILKTRGYDKAINIVGLVASFVILVDIWFSYLNLTDSISISYFIYNLSTISLVIIILISIIQYISNKKKNFDKINLTINAITIFLYLTMIFLIPFDIESVMNHSSLAASIPHEMKLRFSRFTIYVLIGVCLQIVYKYFVKPKTK
jgi:hypothetical protein